MNYDGATGYLVGEKNQGLAAMFTMMNYERLSIGLQGLGCSEMSWQTAVQYARERIQSRAPSGVTHPDREADPIIGHPDVRRMLLTMRAFIDGARAFSLFTGMQLDLAKFHDDESTRQRASVLVALLTPVAKAFISDKGFECCVLGQQVLGGHGYIREWGQEQLVRDARIAQIYEGTNGIQALDLVKRKVLGSKGKLVELFIEEVERSLDNELQLQELTGVRERLLHVMQLVQQATARLLEESEKDRDFPGAASNDYLHLFGYCVYGWMWARILAAVAEGKAPDKVLASRLKVTGEFYFERLLFQADSHFHAAMSPSSLMMDISQEDFGS
jgi:hypothetical protein